MRQRSPQRLKLTVFPAPKLQSSGHGVSKQTSFLWVWSAIAECQLTLFSRGFFLVMDTFNKYRSGGEEETEHENCDLTSMILILWEVYCFDMVEMEKEEGARFVVEVKHYLVKFDF